MQEQRQGVRSTKPATEEEEEEEEKKIDEKLELRQHDIVITIHNISRTLYIDQTGKLLQTSSRGNRYQMILHEINPNSTWVKPMKNWTKGEIIVTCKRALRRICLCGLNPKHQIIDKEASEKYKEAIRASRMTYHLVPPDDHRCNMSKKYIQFWRDHSITVTSGTSDILPLHLWFQVIP